MGELTFYKKNGQFYVMKKPGNNRQRILEDPKFEATRKNSADFGRACSFAKNIRHALAGQLAESTDGGMVGRLNGVMGRVLSSDPVNERGSRGLLHGNISLLKDFEFNKNCPLSYIFPGTITASLEPGRSFAYIAIPSFIPTQSLKAPPGTTHYQVLTGTACIDAFTGTCTADTQETDALPYDETVTAALGLVNTVAPVVVQSKYLIVAGIRFYQTVSGVLYRLKDKAFSGVKVVGVG